MLPCLQNKLQQASITFKYHLSNSLKRYIFFLRSAICFQLWVLFLKSFKTSTHHHQHQSTSSPSATEAKIQQISQTFSQILSDAQFCSRTLPKHVRHTDTRQRIRNYDRNVNKKNKFSAVVIDSTHNFEVHETRRTRYRSIHDGALVSWALRYQRGRSFVDIENVFRYSQFVLQQYLRWLGILSIWNKIWLSWSLLEQWN